MYLHICINIKNYYLEGALLNNFEYFGLYATSRMLQLRVVRAHARWTVMVCPSCEPVRDRRE